jgi:TrmH family RNA methyltransferase
VTRSLKQIASRDNAHYKALLRLAHSGRERRRSGLTLLDGVHLAQSWEAAHGKPQEYIVSEAAADKPEIAALLEGHPTVPLTRIANGLFAELSPVETPSGLLTLVESPLAPAQPLDNVDSVLLDGVQDPGNVGSILRSAAAAGVRQVLLGANCAQAWSPRVLRAGMGAHFALAIHEAADLGDFLENFSGTSVVTQLQAGGELFTAPLRPPLAWVFGSEGQGVHADLAARATLRLRIPMPGTAESLNVAAAAAICLFEGVRRRTV